MPEIAPIGHHCAESLYVCLMQNKLQVMCADQKRQKKRLTDYMQKMLKNTRQACYPLENRKSYQNLISKSLY